MGIQQWLFSFKGRIGRRDFWIWMVLWVVSMTLLFVLANGGMLATHSTIQIQKSRRPMRPLNENNHCCMPM